MKGLVVLDFLMSGLHYIGSFVFILSVIVFIHEYGHYIVARWCGVRVEQFSIGFGKEMFGWNDKHGTRWKVSLLPLGGYVKMFGDADPSSKADDEVLNEMSDEEKAGAFHHKPLWKKACIVVAGPAANFILAIVILTYFFAAYGQPNTPAIVGQVNEDSAAYAAGLEMGDRFVSLDGREMASFSDLQRLVRMSPERELPAVIERDGNIIEMMIVPKANKSEDMFGNEVTIGLLGVQSVEAEYQQLSVLSAVPAAAVETVKLSRDTLRALGEIITGQRSVQELGGPVKIAKYSGQSTSQGWRTVLWFMALLSVNLGLINLFPIPMLDGGHLMFYAVEAATGRPLAEKVQEWGFRVGLAFLVTLMVFTTVNDVLQLGIF